MADSIQIPQSLSDLGDVIRTIERESGQPSQLVVKVGDDKYLVGDLRKRAGEYVLEMEDEHKSNPFEKETVKNPHKKLARTYPSFDALKQAVEAANSNTGKIDDLYDNPHLIGSPDHGYSVAVLGMNLGSAGGQTYNSIGRIIFPLLQDGEKVSVDKISR